jgi:hypothetical protein
VTLPRITCRSCHRSWVLSIDNDSLYVKLNLESLPCPHCEAYTLSCPQPSEWRANEGRRHKNEPRHCLMGLK